MGPKVRNIFACIAFSIYHIHKVSYYNFRTYVILYDEPLKKKSVNVCALRKEVVVHDVTPM